MESYPEDLLVGVFPLVFAVNAIYDPTNAEHHDASTATQEAEPENATAAVSPKHRSDFDRFLDAMAGSLADENDDADIHAQLEFPPVLPAEGPTSGRNVSLFRPDDDEMDESTDDDLLLDPEEDEYNSNVPGASSSGNNRRSSNSLRLYAGFGLTRRSAAAGGTHSHSTSNTSYAKALQHGQGFFQRARIVSVSGKHGFPPSKDPQGLKNIVYSLKQARTSPQKAKEVFAARPIQGILPAGWLEKHVYALPSVILVVVKLSKANQSNQDYHVLRTVENLHYSLVQKRPCKIHVVALVDDEIAVAQAQQWSLDISRQIVDSNPITHQDSHQITLLRTGKDMRSGTDGFPTSVALKRLHRSVRDSSLMYYLGQARRTKEKLAKLSEDGKKRLSGARQRIQPPTQLLPLAIRYCFKIAIFYEFQLKFEKSLKFMAEAYRHVRLYYHHLVRLSARGSDLSDEEEDRNYTDTSMEGKAISANNNVSISASETEEMEVSISDAATQDTRWSSGIPPPPSDMAHQCLAVADWLNFKLLQAGFGSHTEGGLLAADCQWRQHSRVFCARRFLGGHPIMSEEWYFWCHVAHQRLVMSQLVERHPPRALGDFGNEYDEVLLRCAPWRAYEAAAEAYLKAGVGVSKARSKGSHDEFVQEKDDARAPFVGGLDKDGLAALLQKEYKVDHKEKALELVLRAISMFEHEWGKEKLKDAEDQFPHRPWGRFGARLYYVAGGILVGKKQYAEAANHLEQAAKYAAGWDGILVAIRRLLAKCYEYNPPASLEETESNQWIASMVMEACFYTKLPSSQLLNALNSCSSAIPTPFLQWKCECFDEFDSRLPFSFSATFPSKSHATAGDTVVASVCVKSNLNYSVRLDSITLLSMAGQITVPSRDFSGDSENGVIIKPRGELVFPTKIVLPKNLDEISVDESGGGSDKQGKTSYTKSARPRTAGITSAAGARLVSEEIFRKKPRNSNAQWSLNFLGGKPLRCEGILLVLNLVNRGNASVSSKPIELKIEKKKPKTPANIKRTPFEEDNYIASAWCRPLHLPLPSGPRCLRVLGPMSEMVIKNITHSISDGKAVEGTVNRVCLKLQAGPKEFCSEISYSIDCSSSVVTKEGKSKRLTLDETPEENAICIKEPGVRGPVLVSRSQSTSKCKTAYGFDLPAGWELLGSGQKTVEEIRPQSTTLACEESTFIFFDIFRPSAMSTGSAAEQPIAPTADICQTDFEIKVSYKQKRQKYQDDATDETETGGSGEEDESTISEIVSQKFSGSLVWNPPLVATFHCATTNSNPSGSRHPSNLTDEARPSDTSVFRHIPIIDGERVSIRSVLYANPDLNGSFPIEVKRIRFEDERDATGPCNLSVTSPGSNQSDFLFECGATGPSCLLKKQSKFSFVYCVQADMINKKRSATFPLGTISIDCIPQQIRLPEEVRATLGCDVEAHGPLAMFSPMTVFFQGPMCYIEKAPFRTAFKCSPPVPKALVPFEVNYCIKNETNINQRLSVVLDGRRETNSQQEILVCGLTNGDLRLAPFETRMLSYTAVATKPGMTTLPQVYISSTRYNSWVVNEGTEKARPLCILP